MRAVYQPPDGLRVPPRSRALARIVQLFALVAIVACRGGEPGAAATADGPGLATDPVGLPRPSPLEVHLASVDYEPVAVDDEGALLADEVSMRGVRALRVRRDGTMQALAPSLAAPHRAIAPLAEGSVLIEVGAPGGGAAGGATRLALVDPGGALRPVGAADGGERFLGVGPDRRTVRLARRTAAGSDELVELALSGSTSRVLAAAPPGFRIAAVSRDGFALALARSVHDGADEVVTLDRRSGERRLVLPTAAEGRFRPLTFDASAGRLLVATEDVTDLARLEWLDLATGARAVALERPCAALGVRGAGDVWIADLACDGARQAAPLGQPPPWPGRLPAGVAVFAALPGSDGAWWLGLRGARSARDLALLPADDVLAPATWGLAPRLDPSSLVEPERLGVHAAGVELPAEIWRPRGRPAAGLVWLEDGDLAPRWGEYEPCFAFLAGRSIAVLRIRARGADGFGRTLRRAADGDPAGAAIDDLSAARSALAARADLDGRPVAVVGAGAWSGALAIAALARPDSGFAAAVAFDPAADALAALDGIAALPEPARSFAVARFGEPSFSGTVARREELRTAAAHVDRPLLVRLDADAPGSVERRAELEAIAAAGRPLRVELRATTALARAPDAADIESAWRFLVGVFSPPR